MVRWFLTLLIGLLLAVPAGAQTPPTEIERGVAVEAALLTTGPLVFRFAALPGDVIRITVRAVSEGGTIDTTVALLDPDGVRIAFNDDHGTDDPALGTFDSRIADTTLLAGGEYRIQVNSFSGAQTGTVEVLLEASADVLFSTPTPAVPAGGTSTPMPDVVAIPGEVEPNARFTHTLAVSVGQQLRVTVRSLDEAFDPKLSILDAAGTVLAENDDHGTPDSTLRRYDSRISSFNPPQSGDYTLVVEGFAGTGGLFDMVIERIEIETASAQRTPQPRPATLPTINLQDTFLDTVTESINAGDTYTYRMQAEAGDVFTLTARSLMAGFDPRLAIFDQDGVLLAVNEDHGTDDPTLGFFDARLHNIIIPRFGMYDFEVTGYANTAGSFTLTVEQIGSGAPLRMGSDVTYEGSIEPLGVSRQTFEAQAGDFVTLTARAQSEAFDPRLALVNADGALLAMNDDHGTSDASLGFLDARIHNYIIPFDGVYTVEITGYQESAGAFTLTITTIR